MRTSRRRQIAAMVATTSTLALLACSADTILFRETDRDSEPDTRSATSRLPLTITNIRPAIGWDYTIASTQTGFSAGGDLDDATGVVQGEVRGDFHIRTSRRAVPQSAEGELIQFDVNQDVVVYVSAGAEGGVASSNAGGTASAVQFGELGPDGAGVPQRFARHFEKGTVTLRGLDMETANGLYDIIVTPLESSDGGDPAPVSLDAGRSQVSVPSFPGAEGFGAMALSPCRKLPLQVLTVTQTGNNGAGSFRAALAAVKPNQYTIIKFDVAGYIGVTGMLEGRNLRCLYVAGQTAPGDGVTIGAPTPAFQGIRLRGNGSGHQVWRHLRFRSGRIPLGALEIRQAVFDHLSMAWASDKAMIISPTLPDSTVDITVSRSIFAESAALHPTAFQLTGQNRDRPGNARVALLRNFFTGNSYRNPVLAARHSLMLNNLIYNWNVAATKGPGKDAVGEADIVNNYYKAGPMTGREFLHGIVVECTRQRSPNPAHPDISLHVRGNIDPHNSDPRANHQQQTTGPNRVTACYYRTGGSGGEPVPASYDAWRSTRLPPAQVQPVELQATQVPDDVLDDVGSNAGITCTGQWVRRPDAVDQRLIAEYRSRKGVARPPRGAADRGGFPASAAAQQGCPDSDSDGLPDAWEARYRTAANPAEDTDGDGYLNIEEFLNGSDPTRRN